MTIRKVIVTLMKDDRGIESIETVAKLAFVALPLLAIALYYVHQVSSKATKSASMVSGQASAADSSVNGALSQSLGN